MDEHAAVALLSRSHWTLADAMDGILSATTTTSSDDHHAAASSAPPAAAAASSSHCEVCFDDDESSLQVTGPCGHALCGDCWKGYIESALANKGAQVEGRHFSLAHTYSSIGDRLILPH